MRPHDAQDPWTDPAWLAAGFGDWGDALREFEERLDVVRRDLEPAVALRDHRVAATHAARPAVESVARCAG